MAPVFPVTVYRSDGLYNLTKPGGIEVPNTPSDKQLDSTPDADGNADHYRPIDENDPKAIDWKRKLGGMLMRYLGAPQQDRQYYLTAFPEGYRLYEHVKYNVNKIGDPKKRDKDKHAAGPYDRQDAHLYGYPDPAKKRYRSPAEFFHHLLWLASDKAGDQKNCTCRFCSPNGDDVPEESIKVAVPNEKDNLKETKPAAKPIPKPVARPAVEVASAPPRAANPAPSASKQLPAVKSKEQEFDSAAGGKFIYRSGELIWFNNGMNWRLGLIGKRGLYTANQIPRYLIQPLSNPHQHQQFQIKEQQALRPWLAWSVPPTTVPSIQNTPFDQVPWDRVLRGELNVGPGTDYVVDGSILAAKAIDASYSLFDRDETAVVQRDTVAYKGMFLGAEKIWVGEPVRFNLPGADVAVYIISSMIETPVTSTIAFKGDIYKLSKTRSSYTHKSQWPAPSKDLPARMVADLNFRNEIAARAGDFYDWQLVDTGAYKQLDSIKGRWYESEALLPTLMGEQKYQHEISMGNTRDAGEWMNSRRDNNPFPNQRRKNRKDALGRSVPDAFRPSRGLDGPAADNMFPDQQPAGAVQQSGAVNPTPAGFDDINQYMDLDGGQW